MKLSVIVPSYRVGGLDVLCASLATQTHTDFELLFADAIFDYRVAHVVDRLAAQPFPVKHMACNDGVAISNYSSSINNAIVEATGDVIVMMPDFAWLEPECLETHARWHEENRGQKKCVMADYRSVHCPPRHPCFPGYHPELQNPNASYRETDPEAMWEVYTTREAERYELDLKSGALDPVMWSLWANPLSYEEMRALPLEFVHTKWDTVDANGGKVHTEFNKDFCSLKNESIGIDLLEALNGLDEDLDGSHLYQDWELTQRIVALDWEWDRVRGGEITIVNPRPFFTSKRIMRPMRLNRAAAEMKRWAGQAVNPGWSLRERRAERHD